MKFFGSALVFAAGALVLTTSSLSQVPAFSDRQFSEAERRIVRLPPSAFPDLPRDVVKDLEQRGCGIPQEALTKKPHNVVSGEFAKRGQRDWAVLCSIEGISTILVFWNGSPVNSAAIAPTEDRAFLQSVTANEIGFSRGLYAVEKDFIVRNFEGFGGPKPPPIDHQGIDDAFVGKASRTWYFHAGKWLQLQGSD